MKKFNPKIILLFSLGIVTIYYALFLITPGHFSIDEGIYHLMTRSFSDSGNLDIWNGYQEHPSRELALLNVHVHEGRLVPQYPCLFPILATPFYRIAGFRGLFILNAFSFLGVAGLCFALARKLFQDPDLALNACLILFLATFAWEYSQAAWPHAISMLFTTGAIYLSLLAVYQDEFRRSLFLAFAAGVITGLGAGIRLDSIFVFPAVVAPFLFVRPWRPWQTLATIAGTTPGLLLLAATNYLKFGTASPFSYGSANGITSGIAPYLPFAGVALAGGGAFLVFIRIPHHSLRSSTKLAFGIFAAVLGVAFAPLVWNFISRMASGIFQLVVDLRFRNPGIVEPALTRTPSGALIYLNIGLKKSLLQSCPYLTCLALPLGTIFHNKKNYLPLGTLYLASAVFICVFSYFSWHGGLSFNMRYFLPVLPFTSIITAYALRELTCSLDPNWRYYLILVGVLTYVGYRFFIQMNRLTGQGEEFAYLTIPILLALMLLILMAFQTTITGSVNIFLKKLSSTLLIISLVWSGLVAFKYDFYLARYLRHSYFKVSQAASKTIPTNSILFTDYPDAFFGLLEKENVRLSVPTYDDFKDFRKLVKYNLNAGHPVYASFSPSTWQKVENNHLLESWTKVPILSHQFGILFQIKAPNQKKSG